MHTDVLLSRALRLKWHVAALRFEIAMLRHAQVFRHEQMLRKAGFRPDQARDERGRWVDENETERQTNERPTAESDPRVISDAMPDGQFPLGSVLAQNENRYSVDLREEEARGGHAIREHVGKSDQELLADVTQDKGIFGIFEYSKNRQGSFASQESANDFVNSVLQRNQATVDEVANGKTDSAFLNVRFGYRTGREAFRSSPDSEPYLRDTYEVGVHIRHDLRSSRGYSVHTAYPRNSDPGVRP